MYHLPILNLFFSNRWFILLITRLLTLHPISYMQIITVLTIAPTIVSTTLWQTSYKPLPVLQLPSITSFPPSSDPSDDLSDHPPHVKSHISSRDSQLSQLPGSRAQAMFASLTSFSRNSHWKRYRILFPSRFRHVPSSPQA